MDNSEESKNNKKSFKQKLAGIAVYGFLTSSIAFLTFVGGYIVGYELGDRKAYKEGDLSGYIKGFSIGKDEGYDIGKQQVTINITSLGINKKEPNSANIINLSSEEYRRGLFVYKIEREAVMNACELLCQEYANDPNKLVENMRYNSLAKKCQAEIALIEDFFQKN